MLVPKKNQKLLEVLELKLLEKIFRINRSIGNTLRQQKELSRNFWANKTFRYSKLLTNALERKSRKRREWKKRKLNIALQVSQEVFDTFPEMKDFMGEKLEQKCGNKNKSLEGVNIYFFVATILHW